jgi:hypothetical protein
MAAVRHWSYTLSDQMPARELAKMTGIVMPVERQEGKRGNCHDCLPEPD